MPPVYHKKITGINLELFCRMNSVHQGLTGTKEKKHLICSVIILVTQTVAAIVPSFSGCQILKDTCQKLMWL